MFRRLSWRLRPILMYCSRNPAFDQPQSPDGWLWRPLRGSCGLRRACFECGEVEVVDADFGGHELVEERAEERLKKALTTLMTLDLVCECRQCRVHLSLFVLRWQRDLDARENALRDQRLSGTAAVLV